MSDSLRPELDRLIRALNEFLVPLRMGEPLDQSKFEAVRLSLKGVAPLVAGTAEVPKDLVRLLVDLYPQLHGIAGLRQQDEPKLMEWAEDLLEDVSPLLD